MIEFTCQTDAMQATTCLTDVAGQELGTSNIRFCFTWTVTSPAQANWCNSQVAVVPVQMINSGHKHRVAGTLPRVLAGELQVLSTCRVIRVCHESTLELVREAWQIDSALSGSQCGACQAAPVGVKVITLVVGVAQGEGSIQAMLCCSVVRTPAVQLA